MNGELILTSVTYDDGRIAINNAFSGTAIFNNIQVSGYITGSTISGGTLYSGSTDLYSIFSSSNDVTRVQQGSNISTGGTGNLPIVSVASSPSFNNLTVSGNTTFSALSGQSISADTISIRQQIYNPIYSATTGGTVTLDFNNGNVQSFTLTASVNVNVANLKSGARYTIFFNQDAVGGHGISGFQNPYFYFPNGTNPNDHKIYSGASSINMYTFVSTGSFLIYESSQLRIEVEV